MVPPDRHWIWPEKSDARWFQLAFLLAFDVYACLSPDFVRTPLQFAAAIGTCLSLDVALTWFYRGVPLVPVSALISGLGLFLLCDSRSAWPYAFVGAVSILSKHLIRVDGRHLFNPTNFGMTVALLFISSDVTVVPARWGGSLWGMGTVAALGALTVYRADRLDLSLTWVGTFLLGAAARSWLMGEPFGVCVAPATSASFQLFTFFMITDPAVTPKDRGERVAMGFSAGAADAVLRTFDVRNAAFYGLFTVGALFSSRR